MLQNKLHVFVARFTESLVIFVVIYQGCRSGAWRWRARPGTSGARTSERWKSAGGGWRNAAGNTRKGTTAGTGKLTERFRTFKINSKLLSCIMFMIFHVKLLFGDLNTYKRILKDYPLRTRHVIFATVIIVKIIETMPEYSFWHKSALIAHGRYVKILTWLRSFRDKIANFFTTPVSRNSQKRLDRK